MRQAMSYIDAIPAEDKDTRVSLIKTLQAVTEGKVRGGGGGGGAELGGGGSGGGGGDLRVLFGGVTGREG